MLQQLLKLQPIDIYRLIIHILGNIGSYPLIQLIINTIHLPQLTLIHKAPQQPLILDNPSRVSTADTRNFLPFSGIPTAE